jgi:hypothetical protein
MSHETALNQALKNSISSMEFEGIREAYFKAVEGLHALAETLEQAAQRTEPAGNECDALLAEHLIACGAIEEMKSSVLGKIV